MAPSASVTPEFGDPPTSIVAIAARASASASTQRAR
jgi:hypothetical protein